MESILARALEYTLKYWLKSFSRDQFKLQGRTAQLSNLDINGDALHSSLGLPPAISVTTAKVGKLEIVLPYVSNVQIEPIVIQIDRLDLVLEENPDGEARPSSNGHSTSSSGRGSGYGFADKIADGMTIEVRTVNLLLETRGVSRCQGGATWTPPMASMTMRNLLLYTTNENWEVVNLKEARDFSSNKNFIYLFKKLEWESLSIDLLPHPDMFMDTRVTSAEEGKKDDDGAKRFFFGGERFLEGVSGQAYITVQRTLLNDPLGLEVRLHISEAVCPALSEPGLRALLRFLTGLYVCLNRGDVDPNTQQLLREAAGCSLVSILVDHIFFCIKDAEFQLELLMQSLFFSRASISDGEISKNLTQITIDGFFLRDTISRPPCTLIQPSMQTFTKFFDRIPDFAMNFLPPIYPLENQPWLSSKGAPFICIHSLQVKPSPAPPLLASRTVIDFQPLMIHLQEESCLRISSFISDGIVVNRGAVLPDFSVNSFMLTLKEIDLTVPLDTVMLDSLACSQESRMQSAFSGAVLHIENLFLFDDPSLRLRLLDLEKDPACFCLWEDQPIDAGQKKWTAGASCFILSLDTSVDLEGTRTFSPSSGLWRCVEVKEACVEVAMVTPDGSPLTRVPPPGGIVRIGVACGQYLSNASVDQLFFVLDLYAYFGSVSEKIAKSKRSRIPKNESSSGNWLSQAPSDTAVSLAVRDLELRFLENSSMNRQGKPLVQFVGEDLFIKVGHRTLGGAVAISSTVRWNAVEVDCVDAEAKFVHCICSMSTSHTNGSLLTTNGCHALRPVFWVANKGKKHLRANAVDLPFLVVSMVHVIPFGAEDAECHSLNVSASIAGVHLGGGMNYTEALLHRFGILGPDGGPGEGLSKGWETLSSGPLSKLFKPSHLVMDNKRSESSEDGHASYFSHLGKPDDVSVSVELRDWLFSLEGAEEIARSVLLDNNEYGSREERCWHTTFKSLQIKAKNGSKNSPQNLVNGSGKLHGAQKYPVDLITIGVRGLQTSKPQGQSGTLQEGGSINGHKGAPTEASAGVNVEVRMVVSVDSFDDGMGMWAVENLKFSAEQPIEAVVTKNELQHLAFLCKSEVNSMGRVAAGILRLLKLEGSIGQAAIDQLNNLGSGGFDKIFLSSQYNSPSSNGTIETRDPALKASIESLEEELLASQAKCATIIESLGNSEPSAMHLDEIKQLSQKLENIQRLLKQLRTQS